MTATWEDYRPAVGKGFEQADAPDPGEVSSNKGFKMLAMSMPKKAGDLLEGETPEKILLRVMQINKPIINVAVKFKSSAQNRVNKWMREKGLGEKRKEE